MDTDITATVLRGARALIRNGWNKGSLTDCHGNYCLKAAIGLAAGSYEVASTGEVVFSTTEASGYRRDFKATEIVRNFLPEGFDSIPVFNDDPDTTVEDVLAVLDKAIKAAQ